MVDDVPHHHGQIDDLIDEGIGIVAVRGASHSRGIGRLVVDGLVGRQDHALVLDVTGLAAATSLTGRTRDAPLVLGTIRRRRSGGVRRILAELDFEFVDPVR